MGFQMQPYGVQAMLKEGHKHLSSVDEVVLKNIDACKHLSTITRTSLRPNGDHFKMDLMHKKVEVKSIIEEVINNMTDDEEDGEEENADGANEDPEEDGDKDGDD